VLRRSRPGAADGSLPDEAISDSNRPISVNSNRPISVDTRAVSADHLVRAPTRAELTAARRAAHSLAALDRARVLHVPGADADGNAGDRNYLVLAKPNVIMNDIRLRGLAVEGSDAAVGRAPTTTPIPPGKTLSAECGRWCPANPRRGARSTSPA
jgi:hypothetical protein